MVIKVLIGGNYLSLASLLPRVGLIMLLAALANVLVFYLLALRQYILIPISLLGIILIGFLVSLNHDSIASILNVLTLALGAINVLLAIAYAKNHFYSHPRL
jgi:hypothetical protein